MAIDYLNKNGLSYFWTKLKAYFAPKVHTHNAFETKHSYTTAANAAKNWYRIANANTSPLDMTKPIHVQFILTAYNDFGSGDCERWFVNAEVFGRTAHVVVFGNTSYPFSQVRILYENTTSALDANDRPALDLYLNYAYPNSATKIEIEEIYNNGSWTFVADGQLAVSTVPSGFENVACSVRGNGVERSTYSDYTTYLNKPRREITANTTLADNSTYRSTTLNCTGTITITVPSLNSNYAWFFIKNANATSGVITVHPSTTSVLIDGSNADIKLQPGEYVVIHSRAANSYSIIGDGRRYDRCIVSVDNRNNYPFHRIAYIPVVTGSWTDKGITFLINKDFQGGGYGIVRIIFRTNNAASQEAQCSVQWLSRTSEIAANAIQVGFVKTAGASYLDVFYHSDGTYHSAVCRVLAHANARNGVGRGFTVVSASTEVSSTTETDPKTSVESYKTIANAGTALHNQAYTDIIAASDVGMVGTAATASAVAWSGVTGKPTTIAGYGITDAKIANGTITLGSNSITPLTSVPSHNQASNTINAMTGYSKPGSGSAIAASDTLNQAVGKLEAKVDAIDDSNYVHKAGDETITGLKVFKDNLEVYGINDDITTIGLKSNIISIGEDPTTDVQFRVIMSDRMSTLAGHRFGIFRTFVYTNGDVASLMEAFQNVSSNQVHTAISVVVKKDGTQYATAPSTLSSRSEGTDILTRDWIPNDDRIVRTSGDQTIDGRKTFTSDIIVGNRDVRTISDAEFLALCGGEGESQYRAGRLVLYGKDYPNASSVDTTIAGYFNLSSTDGTNVYKLIGSRSGTLTWRGNNVMAGLTTTGSGNAITALSIGTNNVVTATKGSTFLTSHQSLDSCVKTSGDQNIGGAKIFTSDITVQNNAPYLYIKQDDVQAGTTPSSSYSGIHCVDKNGKAYGSIISRFYGGQNGCIELIGYDVTSASATEQANVRVCRHSSIGKIMEPDTNGDILLGRSSHRWKEIWCTQSSINSSSDERDKTAINDIPNEVLDVWENVSWLQFKFKDAVKEKLDNARLHTGVVAQYIDKVFKDKGLDISRYGLFLYDKWEKEEDEDYDENGNLRHAASLAGDSYGIRYVEALCMEAAYMRRENARLKKRVSDLEDRLAALELRLGSE